MRTKTPRHAETQNARFVFLLVTATVTMMMTWKQFAFCVSGYAVTNSSPWSVRVQPISVYMYSYVYVTHKEVYFFMISCFNLPGIFINKVHNIESHASVKPCRRNEAWCKVENIFAGGYRISGNVDITWIKLLIRFDFICVEHLCYRINQLLSWDGEKFYWRRFPEKCYHGMKLNHISVCVCGVCVRVCV